MVRLMIHSLPPENGSSGLLAVIISFFFGPFGAFFCWWMMAKWGFWKTIGIATVFLVLDIVSVLLFAVFIGFILLPIVYIVMLIVAYKACSKGVMEIETTQTIS